MKYTHKLTLILIVSLTLLIGYTGTVTAQNPGPNLVLTRIDSSTFPVVYAYVMAFDEDGFPLTGLTAEDFRLYEDAELVNVDSFTVAEATTQDLRLVIAIDTSSPAQDLQEVKTAVEKFIDTQLTPRDQVALLAFHHEVRLIQDFTNNQEILKQAVRDLSSEETYTKLYATAIEAAQMVSKFQQGHKAVILIPDIHNNIGARKLEEATTQALAVNVPLHIIAFGPKIKNPTELHQLGEATGGRHFILEQASDVAEHLRLLSVILRQGYKLTFISELPADEGHHQLGIGLRQDGEQGLAQGGGQIIQSQEQGFKATLNGIILTPIVAGEAILPNATRPVTVAGTVNLAAQVNSKQAVRSVSYYIDDVLLNAVDATQVITWNSRALLGGHTLRLVATDTTGNNAQATVALNVIAPLAVGISLTPTGNIRAGTPLTIEAYVTAVAEMDIVTLALDATVVQSSTEPLYETLTQDGPHDDHTLMLVKEHTYRFVLSTQGLKNLHELTVQATDLKGNQQTTALSLKVQGIPWYAPERLWVKLTVLSLLLLAWLLALLFLPVIAVRRRRRLRKVCQVHIVNTGNITSRYHLCAGSAKKSFQYEFLHNKTVLAEVAAVAEPPVSATSTRTSVTQTPPAPATDTNTATAGAGAETPAAADTQKFGAQAKSGWDATKKKISQGRQTSTIISNLLINVGSILGPMGRSFTKAGQQIRKQQSNVTRVVRVPERKFQTYKRMSDQAKRLRGKRGKEKGQTPTTTAPETAPVVAAATDGGRAPRHISPTVAPAPTLADDIHASPWVETPSVTPGQTLDVKLVIRPVKRFRRRRQQAVTLVSKHVPENLATANTMAGSSHANEINFHFKGASWLRLYFPALLWLCIIAALVMSIVLWVNTSGLWQLATSTLHWPF